MSSKKKVGRQAESTIPLNVDLQPYQHAYLEAVAVQNEVSLAEAVRIVLNDSAERYGVFDSLKHSHKVPKGARVPREVVDFSLRKEPM